MQQKKEGKEVGRLGVEDTGMQKAKKVRTFAPGREHGRAPSLNYPTKI